MNDAKVDKGSILGYLALGIDAMGAVTSMMILIQAGKVHGRMLQTRDVRELAMPVVASVTSAFPSLVIPTGMVEDVSKAVADATNKWILGIGMEKEK